MVACLRASEGLILALSERDGNARGRSSESRSASPCSRLAGLPFNDSPTFEMLERTIFNPLTASPPGCPARMSAWPENAPDSPESAQDCFTSLRASCASFDPLGLSSRMFPDFSVQTVDETLRKSSAFSWSSAGMGWRGACSTASFSESPNAAAVCSLSEVLESRVPQRFFLSPKAAAGILRRAERRGRELPEALMRALTHLVSMGRMHTVITSSRRSLAKAMPTRDSEMQMELSPRSTAAETTADSEPSRESTSSSSKIRKSQSHDCQASEATERPTTPLPFDTTQITSKGNYSAPKEGDPCHPLATGAHPPAIAMQMTVRRLTPTECETLQGFPKGWTVPATEHWATRSRCKSRSGLRGG